MRPAPFKGNIIVWNIPDDFTETQLATLFDEHGLVLGAKIDRFPEEPGRTARGLVDLAPAKAVEAAIEALDGFRVEARKLKVRKVPDPAPQPRKERPAAAVSRSPSRPVAPVAETVHAPVAPRRPIVEYRTLSARKFATTR
jgi:RNA recognition motif-containing protein